MVLLDAAMSAAPTRIAAVATFDHRTGPHSARAVALVLRAGRAYGVRAVVGRAGSPLSGEAAWRAARWTFLRSVAAGLRARVATAHTLDDQIETIVMRVMRESGARGLAGLLADGLVLRPLLGISRSEIEAYARDHAVEHVDDPTNLSRAHLRNRVRLDLLPAIVRARPEFPAEMLEIGRRASTLRRQLDASAATISNVLDDGSVRLGVEMVREMSEGALRALMPAVAARAGIILDRRGTTRLSEFILEGRPGQRIQLSGRAEAVLARGWLTIRRPGARLAPEEEEPLGDSPIKSSWRFRRVRRVVPDDAWTAELPADRRLTVRRWRAGDRMRAAGTSAARRVKRFFSDAGIAGPERIGWPVVLADGEIIWIPGVRRSDAATERAGRPVLRYRCERNDV
jgi:tRNA(Ile)-lysidine synthase